MFFMRPGLSCPLPRTRPRTVLSDGPLWRLRVAQIEARRTLGVLKANHPVLRRNSAGPGQLLEEDGDAPDDRKITGQGTAKSKCTARGQFLEQAKIANEGKILHSQMSRQIAERSQLQQT